MQFRVIVVTDPQTNPQTHKHTHTETWPITIHCAAKLSAQCNETRVMPDDDVRWFRYNTITWRTDALGKTTLPCRTILDRTCYAQRFSFYVYSLYFGTWGKPNTKPTGKLKSTPLAWIGLESLVTSFEIEDEEDFA